MIERKFTTVTVVLHIRDCSFLLPFQCLDPRLSISREFGYDPACTLLTTHHCMDDPPPPFRPRECVTWHKTDACFQLNQPLKCAARQHHWALSAPLGAKRDRLELRAPGTGRLHYSPVSSGGAGPEITCSPFLPHSPATSPLSLVFSALQRPLFFSLPALPRLSAGSVLC